MEAVALALEVGVIENVAVLVFELVCVTLGVLVAVGGTTYS
jgi:uncharacterized Tic20 family protein